MAKWYRVTTTSGEIKVVNVVKETPLCIWYTTPSIFPSDHPLKARRYDKYTTSVFHSTQYDEARSQLIMWRDQQCVAAKAAWQLSIKRYNRALALPEQAPE